MTKRTVALYIFCCMRHIGTLTNFSDISYWFKYFSVDAYTCVIQNKKETSKLVK